MRTRARAIVFLVPLIALMTAAPARAQVPGGAPMALPLVVPLKKIPIGAWSEYTVDDGKQKTTMRVALVARTATAAEIESQIKGGPFRGVERTIVRLSLPVDDAPEVTPRELVLQLGDAAPMLLPAGPVAQKFTRVDPAKRLGVEDVQVAAGKFSRAEHHQEKGSSGQTIDFWIAKEVLPFGLIKTVSTAPGGGPPVVMELTGRGKGAKPVITKKPGPFDPGALAAAAGMQLPSGGAPATDSGIPQRGVPSPHPGMPPTPVGSTPPPAKKK